MGRLNRDVPPTGQIGCAIGTDAYPPPCWLLCDGQVGLCAGKPAIPGTVFFQVIRDGRAVYVKNAYGLLGRFSADGITVYRSIADRLAGFPSYLFCLNRAVTRTDWTWFAETMSRQHGINFAAAPPPAWLGCEAV